LTEKINDLTEVEKDELTVSFKNAVEEICKKTKLAKENSANIKVGIETKASLITFGNVGSADVASFTNLGIVDAVFNRSFSILDAFPKRAVTTTEVKQWYQTTVNRNAKGLVDCSAGTFDTTSAFAIQNIRLLKIKDIIDFCLDMIDDMPFMQGQLAKLLLESIPLLIENSMLSTNTGVGNILGMRSFAIQLTTAQIASPIAPFTGFTGTLLAQRSIHDLVAVCDGQMQIIMDTNARVTHVFLNPVDYTKMMRKRDTQGNLQNCGCNDQSDNGIKYISTPRVAINTFYAVDTSKGELLYKTGTKGSTGLIGQGSADIEISEQNATNFEREIVSLKAFVLAQFHVANNQRNAFFFCPDINTALTAI
jgi:hypothetical protein